VIFDKCYCVGTTFNGADMRGASFGIMGDIEYGEMVICM
jgi:hypothetical protein